MNGWVLDYSVETNCLDKWMNREKKDEKKWRATKKIYEETVNKNNGAFHSLHWIQSACDFFSLLFFFVNLKVTITKKRLQ